MIGMFNPIRGTTFIEISSNNYLFLRHIISCQTMADVKYGVYTDVNSGVSVTKGGNMLFEVMYIC